MNCDSRWHKAAAAYLMFQSVAVAIWWILLGVQPPLRTYFKPTTAPDVMLFAFALPDAVFFLGAAWWAAWRLINKHQKAILPLALHMGGALYAWLYCLLLWILSGEGLASVLCMLPCVIVPALLLWKLCKTGHKEL